MLAVAATHCSRYPPASRQWQQADQPACAFMRQRGHSISMLGANTLSRPEQPCMSSAWFEAGASCASTRAHLKAVCRAAEPPQQHCWPRRHRRNIVRPAQRGRPRHISHRPSRVLQAGMEQHQERVLSCLCAGCGAGRGATWTKTRHAQEEVAAGRQPCTPGSRGRSSVVPAGRLRGSPPPLWDVHLCQHTMGAHTPGGRQAPPPAATASAAAGTTTPAPPRPPCPPAAAAAGPAPTAAS